MTKKEFKNYFERYYLPLGMYAMRIIEDSEASEDIVQEAFINAWLYLENGKEIGNFQSFIYRAVRNNCITYLRNKTITLDETFIPEVGEEEIETSFIDARIWKAIDELPEKCREIFLMSKRDGLSNQEISEELNISVKTVKNQITKAFGRIRESFTNGHKPFFLLFL